jgi:hypothetical protein
MGLETLLAASLLFPAHPMEPAGAGPPVEIKVTQKSLVTICRDGEPAKEGERRWRLAPGQHSLAFTMRNAPRPGVPEGEAAPGTAVVRFTLEAGHKYEVEIRAPALAFSTRVWERGEWKPVVRDRTADRIVSGEPEWKGSGCGP